MEHFSGGLQYHEAYFDSSQSDSEVYNSWYKVVDGDLYELTIFDKRPSGRQESEYQKLFESIEIKGERFLKADMKAERVESRSFEDFMLIEGN